MSKFEDFLMDSFKEVEEIEKELEIGGKKRKMKFRALPANEGDEIRKKCRKVKYLNGQKIVDTDQDKRSEEHTSELQSRQYLVCRLLLEKKTGGHTRRC